MNIILDKPIYKGTKSLEECIYNRKSIRLFRDTEIELNKISQLLWSAQGRNCLKRTVPSAGALYPLEIYINDKNKGFFYYNIKNNILELKTDKDLIYDIVKYAYNQQYLIDAPINIILTADYTRTCNIYGKRGIRYVHFEIGHCAQNIHLQAVALGLGSVPIGAFNDIEIKRILNLPKNLSILYIICLGYPK
ncbi:MAG: SagB/ThcOx family dehydrogenase [Candidatus Lokiarchaeota archaeon]|nr:SagB/ThcOx family dehydrogenase [Candidatus Lokiarchaeota archaeon]